MGPGGRRPVKSKRSSVAQLGQHSAVKKPPEVRPRLKLYRVRRYSVIHTGNPSSPSIEQAVATFGNNVIGRKAVVATRQVVHKRGPYAASSSLLQHK